MHNISSLATMISKFRVRFAGPSKQQPPYLAEGSGCSEPRIMDYPNRRRKSRFACQECKKRHLKCDETFPVCLRCKQRGVPCRSACRTAQWQIEVPGLTIESRLSTISPCANQRLLQYWMEKASQLMVVDPNNNPFSFGILKYLEASQALVHAIQSLSVAHEHFFSPLSLEKVWEEKGRALALVQQELQGAGQPHHGSLLAVLLVGLYSAWVYREVGDEFGQEHLHGARAILDILLAEPGAEEDPFLQQALAIYLGWDQAVAFLLPPGDQMALDDANIVRCVAKMCSEYNATLAYSIEIVFLLGHVGRYCRSILQEDGIRDVELEGYFQVSLLTFEHSGGGNPISDLMNDTFRKHGLIMLYRAIEASSAPVFDANDYYSLDGFACDDVIKQYANDIIQNIRDLPEGNRCHTLLSLALFSAASELTAEDSKQRDFVRDTFRNLFSITRLPVQMCVLDLLEELWNLSDNGYRVFWLSYILQNSVIFTLC